MPQNRLITVFISCWNQGEYLPAAIESVLAQSYQNFELLLYDDASTDTSAEIMLQYAKQDGRVTAFPGSQRCGNGKLVNASVRQARGDIWVWCPADDRLYPRCLERKLLKSVWLNHQAAIYSHGERINADGSHFDYVTPPDIPPDEFRQVIWRECKIGFTGVWIPKHIFNTAGPFPEDMDYCEDYYWLLQAIGRGVDFVCLPEVLYAKRLHENRTSVRHSVDIYRNLEAIRARAREELGRR